jgi:hypothetical protein
MPRDYSKGKIYKIVDNTSELVYVGSTTEPTLAMRLAKHVASYKQWKQGKSNFVSSYNIIENGDYTIVLLEDFPCENSDQLRAREQYYKETLKTNNKNNPYSGLTNQDYHKQYYEENINKILEYQKIYQKKYREENKEQINEKQKEKHTCSCGGKFTTQNKNQHLKSLKHQAFTQACLTPPIPLIN